MINCPNQYWQLPASIVAYMKMIEADGGEDGNIRKVPLIERSGWALIVIEDSEDNGW